MRRKTRTRPPTTAERYGARLLGEEEPEEVTDDLTSTAVLHLARLTELPKSRKPAGVQTWDWIASRTQGGDDAA